MIPPEVLKEVYEVFENQPNSWSHWSTHNILSSLSSPYCEDVSILFASSLIITKPECEDFGQYFLWCSVPALRLCSVCLHRPRYKFIRVRDALATYGLKRRDVASLPKLKSMHIINYRLTYYMQVLRAILQSGTVVVCRNMFIPTSEQDELPDIPILTSNDFYKHLTFGTIKIKYEPQSLSLSLDCLP